MTYDYIVIGSGFGGSVAALRLSEKGYRVLIVESGKRYRPQDFPKTNWNIRKYLWAPALGCYGIQRLHLLNDVLILSGSGLGGGSLVYANTLLTPPRIFYDDPVWQTLEKDWENELSPFYEVAKKMLGVVRNPHLFKADHVLQEYSRELNREKQFTPVDVGVFFGEPGRTVPDPYFNGRGPERTGCTMTGHCMVGCRDGGKNSLDKNYLHLAEGLGCDILPEHKAIDVKHHDSGEYTVTVKKLTGFSGKRTKKFQSRGVVVAAGVIGTLELLMNSKENGGLPDISDKLGHMVRTNSEVLLGLTVKDRDEDLCHGVSITSGLFVNDNTHIELVRYPKGSDLMGLLGIPLTDGGGNIPRVIRLILNVFRHPVDFLRTLLPFGWAKRSIILLVMQTLDNHLTLHRKRRWWTLFRKSMVSENRGRKIPAYIREANEAARFMSDRMDGIPQNALSEVLLNIPMTAHILGGCIMGVDEKSGVIDKYHRVFNYDNFYVVDGSAMPANLGVNPSLTITAMSERAMSYIPLKSDENRQ